MPSKPQRVSSSRTKRQSRGPNKSQLQAAAIRAAQTHEDVRAEFVPPAPVANPASPATAKVIVDQTPANDAAESRRRSGVRPTASRARTKTGRSAITVHKLTREQEYTFIKADLKRLLVTAGSLAALMAVLLFFIER
jgi:hypothetical protein